MDSIPGRGKSNSDGSEGSANATLACPSFSPLLSMMANSPQLETRLFQLLPLFDMTDKYHRIAKSASHDRQKLLLAMDRLDMGEGAIRHA